MGQSEGRVASLKLSPSLHGFLSILFGAILKQQFTSLPHPFAGGDSQTDFDLPYHGNCRSQFETSMLKCSQFCSSVISPTLYAHWVVADPRLALVFIKRVIHLHGSSSHSDILSRYLISHIQLLYCPNLVSFCLCLLQMIWCHQSPASSS